MLSSLAFVGMLLQISFGLVMPAYSFLKFDFSEAFCLIGGFVCGPVWGLAVAFIKALLHLSLDGDWIGHSINFIAVGSMTLVASLFWQWGKNNQKHRWTIITIGLLSAIIARVIIIIPTNWVFITNTFYSTFFPTKELLTVYLTTVVPTFNSIQGLVTSIVFIPLFAISQTLIKKEE